MAKRKVKPATTAPAILRVIAGGGTPEQLAAFQRLTYADLERIEHADADARLNDQLNVIRAKLLPFLTPYGADQPPHDLPDEFPAGTTADDRERAYDARDAFETYRRLRYALRNGDFHSVFEESLLLGRMLERLHVVLEMRLGRMELGKIKAMRKGHAALYGDPVAKQQRAIASYDLLVSNSTAPNPKKTPIVKAVAKAIGVSESAVWRALKAREKVTVSR